MLIILDERPGDEATIRRVQALAFPSDAEARLVDALRRNGRLAVSLVARRGDEVIGHVAFSPVSVGRIAGGLGLAPLAVVPAYQRQGVGAALVRAGLEACQSLDCGYVVVLGEPAYYGRFGFSPAARWCLRDAYDGGAAFQAIELRPGAIPTGGGLVGYAPEFASVGGD